MGGSTGRGVAGRRGRRVLTAGGCSTITASRTSASVVAVSAMATRTSATPRTPQTPSGETCSSLPNPLICSPIPGEDTWFHCLPWPWPLVICIGRHPVTCFSICTERCRGSRAHLRSCSQSHTKRRAPNLLTGADGSGEGRGVVTLAGGFRPAAPLPQALWTPLACPASGWPWDSTANYSGK